MLKDVFATNDDVAVRSGCVHEGESAEAVQARDLRTASGLQATIEQREAQQQCAACEQTIVERDKSPPLLAVLCSASNAHLWIMHVWCRRVLNRDTEIESQKAKLPRLL